MALTEKILTIGGLDPQGYAGVLADVAALNAVGAHAQVVITAQSNQAVAQKTPELNISDYTLLGTQLDAIFGQADIRAVKIGQVPDVITAHSIAALLPEGVPVVWDTVLASSSGAQLSKLCASDCSTLLSKVTLATPNYAEALKLSGQKTMRAAVDWFLAQGCKAVLITGTERKESSETIEHYLHTASDVYCITAARLPGLYRGSGCRFSSLIALALGRGKAPLAAVQWAQEIINRMLLAARPVANGVFVPGMVPELKCVES